MRSYWRWQSVFCDCFESVVGIALVLRPRHSSSIPWSSSRTTGTQKRPGLETVSSPTPNYAFEFLLPHHANRGARRLPRGKTSIRSSSGRHKSLGCSGHILIPPGISCEPIDANDVPRHLAISHLKPFAGSFAL